MEVLLSLQKNGSTQEILLVLGQETPAQIAAAQGLDPGACRMSASGIDFDSNSPALAQFYELGCLSEGPTPHLLLMAAQRPSVSSGPASQGIFTSQDLSNALGAAGDFNGEISSSLRRCDSPFLGTRINGQNLAMLVDTGAESSVLDVGTVRKLGSESRIVPFPPGTVATAGGVGGTCKILGKLTLPVEIGDAVLKMTFCVLDNQHHSRERDMIIMGMDLLGEYGVVINLHRRTMEVGGISVPLLGKEEAKEVNLKDEIRLVRLRSLCREVSNPALLRDIVKNLLESSGAEKFRRIKMESETYRQKIAPDSALRNLLEEIGYVRQGEWLVMESKELLTARICLQSLA